MYTPASLWHRHALTVSFDTASADCSLQTPASLRYRQASASFDTSGSDGTPASSPGRQPTFSHSRAYVAFQTEVRNNN